MLVARLVGFVMARRRAQTVALCRGAARARAVESVGFATRFDLAYATARWASAIAHRFGTSARVARWANVKAVLAFDGNSALGCNALTAIVGVRGRGRA